MAKRTVEKNKKRVKATTRCKPLHFSSSEEYERWKRTQKRLKEEEEEKENPTFSIYRLYFTHIVKGSRINGNCAIAANTENECREIFEHWAYFHDIDRPAIRKIIEVFWLQYKKENYINFSYNHPKREITEVYQGDYLEYYWNSL